ncbi:protein PF14_0175-like [Camponotus floridanus]|uniref:protein PF14_0175-like n=1 Tax=Camponotus floridanus TaxID=104421 RepID=UPI000DC6702E|nr:protein PF14_0175-like [Camponotus floridanus]
MDDVNINEICPHVEEVEMSVDEDKWIKLNWIGKQNSDNETRQSLDVQKNENSNVQNNVDEDSNTEITETAQTSSSDSKISFINAEPEDISDGISVITESDAEIVNTNTLQISQIKDKIHEPLQMMEIQINKQANRNVFLAFIIGIIVGFILSYFFVTLETDPISNGINTESLKTVSHNIINTCKALTEVNTTLNEIKARTAVDKKIMEHFVELLFKEDSANITNNKPSITAESFNFDPHSLDQVSQLQVSLHVLSSLALIHDKNSSLKNEINEILDIVNGTNAFHENLLLFNNTQNEYNSLALKILQHDSDKIYVASKLFLSNLIKKMNDLTLSVRYKYTKQRHKLIKKLCDLKNILPDDELLKQLTENNQLFKNYDKSCSSNYLSKKLNPKMFEKKNTKINKNRSGKEQIKEVDNIVHTKYDKEKSQKIYDGKNSLSNEKVKNEHYTITKISQNASDKIHNTSQLFPSDLKEKMNRKMLKHICTKYNEKRHNAWLKNKHHKDSKFLEQPIENEENNKESFNWCIKENDYLQSIGIQKDMSKDNFDNILIQLLEDVCPFSTNSCPGFNNVNDVPVMPITSSCKTKNCIANSNNKHDTNSKESVLDYENSGKVLFEENKPKQKDHFKSSDSIKKILNNDDKNIKRKKKKLPRNEIKNRMSEHLNDYHKSKQSFNSRVTKQNNQDYINMDWQSDNKRFNSRRKQRRRSADWYFRRVFSRRKARRHAEKLYQQNIKGTWRFGNI